jgi:ABC-2 type transport system ATP-binding protein
MPSPIIRTDRLSKTYVVKERSGLLGSSQHQVHALRAVTLSIEPGEIFGLLGPNGAGKTTLIKCLTTLLLPTSGQAWVNGHAVTEEEDAVRASIGCMLMGERGLYWKLTGRENLVFFAALYHVKPSERRQRVQKVIDLLDLHEFADRTVETYSSGQKMKLAFAKALINQAPVLVLDEPTNTLDVPSAHALRQVVRQLNGEGTTVLYTTHQMDEAETLCQRVAIVDQGQVIAQGTVPELKRTVQKDSVIRVEGIISQDAADAVAGLPGISQSSLSAGDGSRQLVVVSPDMRSTLPQVIETLLANQAVVQYMSPADVTLEDVFIALTGRSLEVDTALR